MVARRIPTGIHPLWEGMNEAAAAELIALKLSFCSFCGAGSERFSSALIKASVSRQFVQNKQTQSLAWCCMGDYCCHLADVRFKLLKDELRSVCSAPALPGRETLDW